VTIAPAAFWLSLVLTFGAGILAGIVMERIVHRHAEAELEERTRYYRSRRRQ
jgi:hypothetical protein